MWIIGRTETLDTSADIAAVNALQAQYKLTPLAHWRDPNYKPPEGSVDPNIDTKDTPTQQAPRWMASSSSRCWPVCCGGTRR